MADLPQKCPGCKASLKDVVPPKYRKYRKLFTKAIVDSSMPVKPGYTGWRCPTCGHRWYTVGIA